MSKTTLLTPKLSEKTYALAESKVYAVGVDKKINKHEVKRAIEAQFEVKVKSVRIANIKGKTKRVMSLSGKRYRNSYGKRNDLKKAYVTLSEGSLPFFAAIEEEEKQEEATQKQFDKAIDKQASKDTKKKRGLLKRKSADKAESEETK